MIHAAIDQRIPLTNHEHSARGATSPLRALVLGLLVSGASAASAQGRCRILCAPTVDLMPGVIHTHLFGGPRVRSLSTGSERRLPSASDFELIFAVASQTAVPRLTLFGSVQWLPNVDQQRNPYTLYTAGELGGPVHANAPTATFGLSGALLQASQTQGWADLAANVGDQFSQAARPDDRSSHTHKLDLELIAHVHALAWVPAATYLHRVTIYGILDYVATGLPRADDIVPQGREFLTAARPAALILGLALPITPPVE